MPNFQQICRIKTKYGTDEPELDFRESQHGKFLAGKIQWLDGKDREGKPNYTWFNFYAASDEIRKTIIENISATFKMEGWLKNKWRKDEKTGDWKGLAEIFITKASVYEKEQNPVQSFHEVEENNNEIPF
jgi:hypothetical protein